MHKTQLKTSRIYGIDLLRLIAAFYVVVLHSTLQGGVYAAAAPQSYQYYACQILLAVSNCSIPLFGIISGYTGYSETEKPYRISASLLLWLEAVLYGVCFSVCLMLFCPGTVPGAEVLSMFFPIRNNLYWYFSAYLLLLVFMPLLNSAVRHCSRQSLLLFFFVILFLLAPFETFTGFFCTNGGYSFLWLMILYLLGAILRKLRIGSSVHPLILAAGIAASTAFTAVLFATVPKLQASGIPIRESTLEQFTFPLYVAASILYVLLFERFRFPAFMQKLIRFAAPSTFAVYITNVNQSWWRWLDGRLSSWASSSVFGLAARILLFSFLFVAVVAVADCFRRKLFRILHLQEFLQRFDFRA